MTTDAYDVGQCFRCGFCCHKVICLMGLAEHRARFGTLDPEAVCPFLLGNKPGEHSCQLIELNPERGDEVAIGGGCSCSLFNDDREAARRHLGVAKRPFPLPFVR